MTVEDLDRDRQARVPSQGGTFVNILLQAHAVYQLFPADIAANIHLLATTIVDDLFGGEAGLIKQLASKFYSSLFSLFKEQHGSISFIHATATKHGFNMTSTSSRALPSLACFDVIDHALRGNRVYSRDYSPSKVELMLKMYRPGFITVISASPDGTILSLDVHASSEYCSVNKAMGPLQQLAAIEKAEQTAILHVESSGTAAQSSTPLEADGSGETGTDAGRSVHNKKRTATRKATLERRKGMVCKTYELKINKSRMSRATRNFLIRLFLEAKWFYNYVLGQPDPFNVDTKVTEVPVKVGDRIEERELMYLSSRIKQELAKRVETAIKALGTKKKKGVKVGKLKFKSHLTSIPLKQYGKTHRFLTDKRLKIENLRSSLRIRGYDQIPRGAEFANAHLITKHGDYFLKVTAYLPKGSGCSPPEASVGIDTGLAHQFTFSNGVQVRYRIPVTDKLRKLYRKLSRQQRWSNNWYETLVKIQKEFVRISNTKKDIRNKMVSFLRKNYKIICFQDENVKAWQRIWGSKILNTSLGAFLTALQERTVTPVEVDRFFPSTQLCSNSECGHQQKMALDERIYICPQCGLVIDRDYNSSINIEFEGLTTLGLVWTGPGLATAGSMPVETRASTLMLDYFNSIPYVEASRVAEPSRKETGSHLGSVKEW
ncbi:MAG: RNA-guided endonuclease InsQ/TnpB family protein [Candidatus Odinarchaeota archaeon]